MWEIKLNVSYNVKEKNQRNDKKKKKNPKGATHIDYELQKEFFLKSGKIKK